jgi:hypothetical protein
LWKELQYPFLVSSIGRFATTRPRTLAVES